MEPKQPKIVQRLLLRTFFLLMSVAIIFLVIQKVLDWRADPDSGTSDTSGMIGAIQVLDDGQQAVIFDKAGKKVLSPDYQTGKTDQDLVWRPDGNRLFFISDRKERAYQIYRWNPGNEVVDPKSSGSISRFDPSFPGVEDPTNAGAVSAAGQTTLVVQGGFVIEYDLKNLASHQLLPPPGGVTMGSDPGEGGTGQFDAIYKKIGNSFRRARWVGDRDAIAAVMKRDEGEILILQKLNASDEKDLLPRPLMAGEHLFFDVARHAEMIVFTVQSFEFPDPENPGDQYVKNGKAVRPFSHGVFAYDATNGKTMTLARVPSDKDSLCFGPPSVSPDGSQVAITTGIWDGTDYKPQGLIVMPVAEGAASVASPVVRGEIYEPSWSPDGRTLVYVKREGGKRSIFTIGKDGSNEKKISDDGDYLQPKFSPQTK